ncbi:hypothetical protein P4120_27165 [Bacillus thuringiensis]|nr:hypothetical protein [Bacillus thuringiensis]
MEKSVVIEEFTSDWALQLGLTIHAHQLKSVNKLKFRSAGLKHS